MDRVVHFEIPADDVARAKAFYGSIFGWELQDYEMPGGTEVPNMGWFAYFEDPEGNTLGLWESVG